MATIDEISLAEDPDRWEALGFAVADGACQLAGVRVALRGEGHDGGMSWSLRGASSTDLDGLPTSASEQPVRAPALPHPNGAVGIDHVVAISPCFERSVAALQAAGLELRRIREEPTPAGAPRQAFFRLGREILELVAEPEQAVARGGGPDRPARFWGLAILVDDVDAAVAAMAPHAKPPRAAVQPGRRISTLARSAGLSVPVALISRGEGAI